MFSKLKSDILNNADKNNIQELQNELNNQKKKLSIFLDLETNYKIGKYNNGDYYIVYPNALQKAWRWFYDENREKTFVYLDEDFSEFCKILDKLLSGSIDFVTMNLRALRILSPSSLILSLVLPTHLSFQLKMSSQIN